MCEIPWPATRPAWTTKWQYFNPPQRLAGLGCLAVMTTLRLRVPYPRYVMTKLAVQPAEIPEKFLGTLAYGVHKVQLRPLYKRQLSQRHILAGSGTDLMSQ
jgi:hypothetical protein